MRMEVVRNWMSTDVITVSPETTLPDAAQLMTGKTIRRLPIIDDGHLVGIVTYGDIRNARPSGVTTLSIWELNYLVNKVKMADIMTKNPVTVTPETTIGEAAEKMLTHMISGLPVLDDQNDLVGIITESDIFRLVARTWAARERTIEPYIHYG